MKILIIGGSYFIGWNLLQSLAKDPKNKIWVLNRGTKKRVYPKNVTHIACDRNDKDQLASKLGGMEFDVVYDVSSYTGMSSRLVFKILNGKVGHFIHISTAAVYLESEILPIKEDFPTGRHRIWGEYGENKLDAEKVLMEANKNSGFPVTIVRPSYVYGKYNNIPREEFLFERISEERTILIPGDGEALLQLGHVYDLVSILMQLPKIKQSIGEVYNISTDEYISINNLVDLVGKIMGIEPKVVHVDTKIMGINDRDISPFDNETYYTDISKAKSEINYITKIDLKNGFSEAFKDYGIAKAHGEIVYPNFSIEDDVINRMKKIK